MLKQKIQKLDLTKTPVVLDSCTTILNSKKFVESHFKIIEANSGNPRFLPYYLRLLKFYETQYNPTKPT